MLVLPYRGAAATAKTLTTIDWLSGRRLIVGVGAAWLRVAIAATRDGTDRSFALTGAYDAAARYRARRQLASSRRLRDNRGATTARLSDIAPTFVRRLVE